VCSSDLTGLGGRLDATNVITPILSVITNISLDHTAILGNTLAEIAREKAGIIKPSIPVVLGESREETEGVFALAASGCNSDIFFPKDYKQDFNAFELPLLGDHQRENALTAWGAVQVLREKGLTITNEHFQLGLNALPKNTGYMGRVQVVRKTPLVIVDGAHNPAGVQSALKAIQTVQNGRLFLIYGASSDKDIKEVMNSFPIDASVSLCVFSSPRSMTYDQLKSFSIETHREVDLFNKVSEAYPSIFSQMTSKDTLLIFGSFFLVADFFQFLGSNACEK
jgi:dihydrofolate synthase/folylpolyglutamate synthase